MYQNKLFLFTIVTIFLSKAISASYQRQEYVEQVVQRSSDFMGYLVDVNADALQGVKNDIRSFLNYESSASNLSDALLEFYSADPEAHDTNLNMSDEELTKKMEDDIHGVLKSHKTQLLELNTEGLFQDLQDVYMSYLLSFMNYFLKKNINKFQMKVNIFVQIQKFFAETLLNDEDFVKSKNVGVTSNVTRHNNRISAFNSFVGGVAKEESMKVMKFIHEQEVYRTLYAKLRKEHALNYSRQVKALFYSMTRGINFNIDDYSKTKLRMSEIAFAYFRCIADLEDEDTKLDIINELRSEMDYAKEFETEENPISLIFSYSMESLIKVSHIVNPDLTASQFSFLFPRVTTNADTMGPFFKNLYDQYANQIWADWNNEEDDNIRAINSIMMVEIFNHVDEVGIKLSSEDIDNYVSHIGDLMMAPLAVLNLANVFEVFFQQLCPLDENIEFYYYLYRTLLEFRFKNLNNWDDSWSVTLDQYFDLKYDNEVDEKYHVFYPTMKILNVFRMLYKNENVESIQLHELSENVVSQIAANESLCVPLQTRLIRIVKTQYKEVKTLGESLHHLSGLVLNFEILKTIFKIQIDSKNQTQTVERELKKPATYEFSAKVYSGVYKNLKGQIQQKEQPKETPKIKKSSSSSEEQPEIKVLDAKKSSSSSEEQPEIKVLDAKKSSSSSEEQPEIKVLDAKKSSSSSEEQPDVKKSSFSSEEKPEIVEKITIDDKSKSLSNEIEENTGNYIRSSKVPIKTTNDLEMRSSEQSYEFSESEEDEKKKLKNLKKKSSSLSSEDNSSDEDEKNLNNLEKQPNIVPVIQNQPTQKESSSSEEPNSDLIKNKNGNGQTESSSNEESSEDQPKIVEKVVSKSSSDEDIINNKINQVDRPKNLVEVVAGGDLTRQELDILENPNVMNNLKDMQTGERKIVYENSDGSITEIIYVQVVPYKSPCYDKIKIN